MTTPIDSHEHGEILPSSRLLDRVAFQANKPEGRKIMFVVGSPLTEPERGSKIGVANVGHMIDLVLHKIEERQPDRAAELRRLREEELLDGALYQQAMGTLGEVFNVGTVNEVVRRGVLQSVLPSAYTQETLQARVTDVQFLRGLEQEPTSWSLRSGVDALGQLLATGLPGFAPVVLTSNFDPLIEVAIRKYGGTSLSVKFSQDGGLDSFDLHSTPVKVIHFHGSWLEGATLHTPSMLTTRRPLLTAAIQRLLEQFDIVPIAYGGWTDIFTNALAELCSRDSSADVRWGLYPQNHAKARGESGHIMSRYPSDRVHFYRGVDCHSFFPELASRLLQPPVTASAVIALPSLATPALARSNTDISSHIDWEAVRVLRREIEARSQGATGTGDDWSFLETKLCVLERDAEQRLRLTRDAVLLVGTDDALRGMLPRPIVDLTWPPPSSNTDPTVRWNDRARVEKNLVWARRILLERFTTAFQRELSDGRVESAASGVVAEKPGYIAFREAAINLLVHQDYTDETTKAVIQLSSESWFFENPGCPSETLRALVTPTALPYRNPLINRAFRDAGWTENGKTGIRAINAAWSRLRRAAPEFTLLPNENRFRVEFSFAERATTRTIAWIAQLGLSPSHHQHDFLELLASRTRHDKAEFQLAMGLPTQEFEGVIRWAVLQGILQEAPLTQGEIAPTESFAARMPSANPAPPPDVPVLADNAKSIGDLSDKTIKVLTHCAEGITTEHRLQEVTGEARATIRRRLQELQARDLVTVRMDGKTRMWTLTEAGQRTARALAR